MGNRNIRMKRMDLANYGAGYDPYYNYGGIENYGSVYQPMREGYPIGYGITDGPLITSVRPSGGADVFGQQGLGMYGNRYPPGFNPMLQPGLSGPKIRLIYVPPNVLSGFQNLLQQNGLGGVGGMNPLMSGLGGMNPLMGGLGGMNPLMGGVGGINPLMGGLGGVSPMMPGVGGYGIPQMIPQSPYALPFSPQMSLPQMGSNCWSMSYQLPSVGSPVSYPIPCPPPMILPVMPQIPIRKTILYL